MHILHHTITCGAQNALFPTHNAAPQLLWQCLMLTLPFLLFLNIPLHPSSSWHLRPSHPPSLDSYGCKGPSFLSPFTNCLVFQQSMACVCEFPVARTTLFERMPISLPLHRFSTKERFAWSRHQTVEVSEGVCLEVLLPKNVQCTNLIIEKEWNLICN